MPWEPNKVVLKVVNIKEFKKIKGNTYSITFELKVPSSKVKFFDAFPPEFYVGFKKELEK